MRPFRRIQSRPPSLRSSLDWLLILLILLGGSVATGQSLESDGEVPETFEAQGKKKFRKSQTRPIKLGTSGGSVRDFTQDGLFVTCCGGTLGALVEKNGEQHILSNNHVIARANLARKGEAIGQPGLIDQNPGCLMTEADFVADLTTYKKIKWGGVKNNKIDAAIARVRDGAVDPEGRLIEIGIPGNRPVEPRIGMQVVKVGRTSGVRRGTVVALNVIGNVTFEPRCGSDETKRARFVDQFVVQGNNKKFSASGDSGSIVLQDLANCPPPVGLLFAGNDDFSLVNRATQVAKILGNRKPKGTVTFVGCNTAATTAAHESSPTAQSGEPLLEDRDIRAAQRVQERRQWELLGIPGVEAIGVGPSLSGAMEPAIHVFVSEDRHRMLERVPRELEGIRTEIIVSGPFVAH